MHRILVLVAGMLILVTQAAISAQSQPADPKPPRLAAPAAPASRLTAQGSGEGEKASRINEWTVGVAGGQLEGTFSKFAVELAKAFDDAENLRILPVITYGGTENVSDLLYLKGIDIAITNADVFEEYRKKQNIGNIQQRINYIAPMYVSELYILVRPEIKTVKDLEGKTVSLGVKGAGQTITGPIVFNRMHVKVETIFMNNSLAYEKMKTGELAGLVHQGGKPNEFITNMKVEPGFHLLSIPYGDEFADYYVPATLTSKDYPNLIKEGETVTTVGNLAVLAVYNWAPASDRYRRVERFIEYFFERFDKLKGPTFHPKWKEINLAGTVPGWTRYPVAERMLAKLASQDKLDAQRLASSPVTGSTRPTGTPPNNAQQDQTEEQRLFNEFLDWKKKAARRN